MQPLVCLYLLILGQIMFTQAFYKRVLRSGQIELKYMRERSLSLPVITPTTLKSTQLSSPHKKFPLAHLSTRVLILCEHKGATVNANTLP